jgi:hypothetical protein
MVNGNGARPAIAEQSSNRFVPGSSLIKSLYEIDFQKRTSMTNFSRITKISLLIFGLLVLASASWAQKCPPAAGKIAQTYGIDSFGQIDAIRSTAGLVPGGGPMARLSRLMGRGRALEVILSANDIPGDLAERYGYVNRSLPDADLDGFVDALATRIASFDKQTIMETKRLVNVASLPPDIEIESGWDACVASMARPATQQRIKMLIERGFCKPGDAENRLGDFVGKR